MVWSHPPTDSAYPSRPRCAPQHRMNNDVSAFNKATSFPFSDESTHSGFNRSGARPRGRGGGSSSGRFGGRGRGRAWWSSRRGEAYESSPHLNHRDPFDISDKFGELEVVEETENAGVINFDAYESIPVESSGANIPPSANTFAEIDLQEDLKKNIQRCKYVKPTPIQRHAIPIAVAGRDLMACAQTGSGKTAAFCFPIISGILKGRSGFPSTARGGSVAYPTALILCPTRELSCQVHDEAKKFAYQTGVKIVVAYGGASMAQQLRNLGKGVDILVATPGRLVDIIERERVSLTRIKYLALDEADRMLDMGFEHQIRKIVEQMYMPRPGVRQTMLFSATFPNDIQKLASDFLSNYIFLAVGKVGSSTELIVQKIELVPDIDKRNHLMDLLRCHRANGANGKQALTLVFVETKRGADALENWLSRNGFPAIAIHGDKVQIERERALRSFKSGATPILVATDVASRGLDIPHVSHVINFDLPRDIDNYVHRIGRTGRAGKSGLATAFFSDKNIPIASALVGLMQEAHQEIPSWLIQYTGCSSSNGRSNRAQRYGSGKYGGHDFRHVPESEVENYNYFNTYGSVEHAVESYNYTDTAFDTTNSRGDYSDDVTDTFSANADLCGSGKIEDGPCGYASVVPTGWD